MRVFPSIPAAIVTGAVVLPVCIRGMEIITATLHPGPVLLTVQLIWSLITFFMPILLSTMDMRYSMRRWREVGFFSPMSSREDFLQLYIPCWGRMVVMLVSTVVAVIVLKGFGLNL